MFWYSTLWWWWVFLLFQLLYFQRVRRQCCLKQSSFRPFQAWNNRGVLEEMHIFQMLCGDWDRLKNIGNIKGTFGIARFRGVDNLMKTAYSKIDQSPFPINLGQNPLKDINQICVKTIYPLPISILVSASAPESLTPLSLSLSPVPYLDNFTPIFLKAFFSQEEPWSSCPSPKNDKNHVWT